MVHPGMTSKRVPLAALCLKVGQISQGMDISVLAHHCEVLCKLSLKYKTHLIPDNAKAMKRCYSGIISVTFSTHCPRHPRCILFIVPIFLLFPGEILDHLTKSCLPQFDLFAFSASSWNVFRFPCSLLKVL